MKIIVCIGAVLSIVSVYAICLLIKFRNNSSNNDKPEENGCLSDMTALFENDRAFLHMNYRLDDPDYVPSKDEIKRSDDNDENTVDALLEKDLYPFRYKDCRLNKARKNKETDDTNKAE